MASLAAETKSLGSQSLYKCARLVNLFMSDRVETIDAWTFSGCSCLEMIVLSRAVSFIGANAFDGCTRLKSVLFCNTSDISYGGEVFPGNPSIYVSDDYEGETFCGRVCKKLLDGSCNIPSRVFTGASSQHTCSKGVVHVLLFAFVFVFV